MRIPRILALPGFCPAVHHANVSRMTAALGPATGQMPSRNPSSLYDGYAEQKLCQRLELYGNSLSGGGLDQNQK
ncbi:hypothetical protein Aam_021_020 [Acidocella aminolytica 101 = DSM 11237]|jgi:hypothetical protein|uniref:Uncharacterized protein n=1 Tax=Acidocella aminolytica 101 = DSM 11237 TaxID=1120923 RepID=A0A0D6PCP1_9PROT|nr:hypothetical protein Aam_021_020 [Acidocella aminolytica 101 = DSM 11237]